MVNRIGSVSIAALSFVAVLNVGPAFAAEASAESVAIDTVWTMVAAFVVFLMQAGFSFLEGGLTRAKNAGNFMMKKIMDFGVASFSYWAIGFVFISSLALFAVVKATIGLRVSEEEEMHGLDIHEHGMWGYPEQFISDLPTQTARHYRAPGTAQKAAQRIAGQEE